MNNDLDHKEEQELNPPPKSYKVSLRAKIVFVFFALAGFGLYGWMLVYRRMSESQFLLHQDIAPIKLMPSLMPAFMVVDPLTGKEEILQFVGDGYTLLNIWATWCPPCQKEMPSLDQLAASMSGRGHGLRVVALSVDDDQKAIVDFIANNKLGLKVLWDKDKKGLKHLSVEKYPETFLISPEGYLITQFSGPRDWISPQVVDYFLNVLK